MKKKALSISMFILCSIPTVAMATEPPMDARLQKLSDALSVALDEEHKNSTESDRFALIQKTLVTQWGHVELGKILVNPTSYKEPTNQFTLLSTEEFNASLRDKNVPQKMIDSITMVNVDYRGFNGEVYNGQIVVHKDLAASTERIFKRILNETDIPLTSVIPVSFFGWADTPSWKFNNTSAFNWRLVGGSTEVSDHAFGSAIDINPYINPWMQNDTNPRYNVNRVGTWTADSPVVQIFKDEGWKWGGDWKNSKDWQHFYRPGIPLKYFGKEEVPE
jgi:peptidoglycan L-alanyl-D-glutamate endopeptidase CwlK